MLSAKVLVRSTHEGFAESIRWHLGHFVVPPFSGSASYTLSVYVRPEDDLDEPIPYSYFFDTQLRGTVEEPFLGDLLGLGLWEHWQALTATVRDFLLLHAGAVVIGGGAVVMPAPSNVGKSSLTLALLQEGAEYLSDEFGVIDPVSGDAYPLARPLSLDQIALDRFPGIEDRLVDKSLPVRISKRSLRPEDIDASVAHLAPIRAIVVPAPDFEGPARLEPITRAAAVENLVSSAFNLGVFGERGVVLISRALADAEAFRVIGGDPASRAGAIVRRLS